jgi:putative solute:sodium symporter small subunit
MPTTTATRSPGGGRRAAPGELTEQQREEYWRYNVKLTTILLAIWFVVTFLISGLWAGYLNQWTIIGFPLGYYMAAQGSLAIFVIEIAVYAWLMNKKDEEFGIREEG